MRIADLTTGTGQLRDAMDKVQIAWSETKEHWKDASAKNLEEQHLTPLAVEVAAAYPVIMNLASVFAQAERECAPWS